MGGCLEPCRRVRDFVRGLLALLPRENCWAIAERAALITFSSATVSGG